MGEIWVAASASCMVVTIPIFYEGRAGCSGVAAVEILADPRPVALSAATSNQGLNDGDLVEWLKAFLGALEAFIADEPLLRVKLSVLLADWGQG